MIKLVVFAQPKAEVINLLKTNPKLKGKIYHLHTNEDWELGSEGLLYLDIEKYLLPDFEDAGVYDKCPICDEKFNIPINTHNHIYKKCKCYVDYLPSERAVAYLKTIAKETKSLVGIGMEHERGDMLYDIYCWIFDYRIAKTSPQNTQTPANEYIYACYEGKDDYEVFHLEGCKAKVVKHWHSNSGTMLPFEKMNEAFGVKKSPYWVDLRNYELNSYKI